VKGVDISLAGGWIEVAHIVRPDRRRIAYAHTSNPPTTAPSSTAGPRTPGSRRTNRTRSNPSSIITCTRHRS